MVIFDKLFQYKEKLLLQLSKKNLIYFSIFLILLKLIYLVLESYYNGQLIDIVTNRIFIQDDFEYIEKLGHRLSAVGFTLMFLPLFFVIGRLFKRWIIVIFVTMVLSILSVYGIYQGLEKLMNVLVESQKDKRYEAYYVNLFKYGILGGKVGYEAYVPRKSYKELSIEDKVLIANIFLLTHLDENLVERFVSKGKNDFLDIYINQFDKEEYIRAFNDFKKNVSDIQKAWNLFQDGQKKINQEFSKEQYSRNIIGDYKIFRNEIFGKYREYEESSKLYNQKLNSHLGRVKEYEKDLIRYFNYRGNSRAESQYSTSMYNSFGKYINPERWCWLGHCPNPSAIRNTIQQEAEDEWNIKSQGIPPNLTQKAFFLNNVFHKQVIDNLRAKGIMVEDSFNYSQQQFEKAYWDKVRKEYKKAKDMLVSKIKNKLQVEVKLGMTYAEFVILFDKRFTGMVSDKKYKQKIISMIEKGDLNDFYSQVYKPMLAEKNFTEFIPSKDDFNHKKYFEKGDISIKMLYIPPFAIFMSLLAAILNGVTVLTSIFLLPLLGTKFVKPIKIVMVSLLMLILIYYPYSTGKQDSILSDRKAMNLENFSGFSKMYASAMNWIIVMEKINYDKVYVPLIKNKMDWFKKSQG